MDNKQISQIQTSFTYKNVIYRVDWFDIDSEIPDITWQQVYAIGDINGKVPVVHYGNGDPDNLPGGKFEAGENIEETLNREIQEELNCEVISWMPIGYQVVTKSDGSTVNQLRVVAKMRPIGEFINDPGGSIIGHSLVALDDLNLHINYGSIGDRMVEISKIKLKTLE